VRGIQQSLKDRGFDPGLVDGIMGGHTASALRDYQRSERLPTTGELDLATVERLGASGPRMQMTP
jgi:peptidoglycan hydrolase-like protein with peptidoglycan-binding domain